MKLQSLFFAVALVAGASFAQAPNGTAKAPADQPAAAAKSAASPVHKSHKMSHKKQRHEQHASAKHHHQHMAKAKHHEHFAKAKHHEHFAKAKHHEYVASAKHHGTHMMGAGPASPSVDLNSPARQHRMDQAYNDWLARRR
jgi:hypothetical protein